jgi:prolyl 4-hydroxylase
MRSRLACTSHPYIIILRCPLCLRLWAVSPQLVRYFPTQRYDLHTDFWPRHQRLSDGSGRLFNRPASFFVFLRDNCTAGETWFPSVTVEEGKEVQFNGRVKRGKEDGGDWKGVRFRPVTGSAVFWVNIPEREDGSGKGDRRVVHAGLPVGEGEKIGMNIWPRRFYAHGSD